ncbi:hypothetical protein ILUMI_03749 [Ignelater luminosus]|uniref:Uncharacterized protein n=1 Tax=Ignelater luminosus TaxID=2038154 RepID=A0A8K0DG02_IGNLU|nr:hypothetical protein ILUMI_03749 [Ignelater luminosus]
MPKYKKKLGSRNYKNYSSETLIKALNEIRSKKLSLNQASPGRPNVLDDSEEKTLVHILIKTAEWGFPVADDNLRHIVKAYLDKQEKTVGQLHQNILGKDWEADDLLLHCQDESDDANYLESLREELADDKTEEEAILNTHNTIGVEDYILEGFGNKNK